MEDESITAVYRLTVQDAYLVFLRKGVPGIVPSRRVFQRSNASSGDARVVQTDTGDISSSGAGVDWDGQVLSAWLMLGIYLLARKYFTHEWT